MCQVDEDFLYDLFNEEGPKVVGIKFPRDPVTNKHSGFGFVEYDSVESANEVSVARITMSTLKTEIMSWSGPRPLTCRAPGPASGLSAL